MAFYQDQKIKKTKKVILLENDSHHIAIYRRMFQNTAFEVDLARTREEMLEELREIRNGEAPKPDLVLMDFILADGYGTEVLRAIKKSHFTRDIPVFAVTNFQNPDMEREMKRLGIFPDKYMMKAHHTPAELINEIENYLEQRPIGPDRPKTNLA